MPAKVSLPTVFPEKYRLLETTSPCYPYLKNKRCSNIITESTVYPIQVTPVENFYVVLGKFNMLKHTSEEDIAC